MTGSVRNRVLVRFDAALWRRGVVVSVVRRMNEVSTWMGDRMWACILFRYVTSQLGQLRLVSIGVTKLSTSLIWLG